MKVRTIEANFGTGTNKVFAGTVELQIPESFLECVKLFGSESKTIELAIRSYLIEERVKLKARPKKPSVPLTELEKQFMAMDADRQTIALEMLRDLETPANANANSELIIA